MFFSNSSHWMQWKAWPLHAKQTKMTWTGSKQVPQHQGTSAPKDWHRAEFLGFSFCFTSSRLGAGDVHQTCQWNRFKYMLLLAKGATKEDGKQNKTVTLLSPHTKVKWAMYWYQKRKTSGCHSWKHSIPLGNGSNRLQDKDLHTHTLYLSQSL